MNNLYVADYGTTSVTDSDSDFTNDMWNGGCLWNNVRHDAFSYLTGFSRWGIKCFSHVPPFCRGGTRAYARILSRFIIRSVYVRDVLVYLTF